MTITIRQGMPADLADIVNHYGPPDTPWDPFGNLERLKGIPLEGLIVAEIDDNYAGFLYWFIGENPWFDPGTKRFAYITDVHILKEHQRQGLGKKLLAYALKQLEGNPVKIFISTTENNTVARHLYEGVGFREFSRTIHYKLETDKDRTYNSKK
jgi:ribosomal protein S18 acetylase RimI-like enzyme